MTNNIKTIDIETIPILDGIERYYPARDGFKSGNIKDPAKLDAKYDEVCQKVRDKAALNAHTGQVALIGLLEENGHQEFYQNLAPGDEAKILAEVWGGLAGHITSTMQPNWIIGHNILNFDFPFMARRSFILGVKVPSIIIANMGTYSPKFFRDTMRMWFFGSKNDYIALDMLCQIFGIERIDTGIEGKDFYKHWETDKQKCMEYCGDDLVSTRAAFDHMDMGV